MGLRSQPGRRGAPLTARAATAIRTRIRSSWDAAARAAMTRIRGASLPFCILLPHRKPVRNVIRRRRAITPSTLQPVRCGWVATETRRSINATNATRRTRSRIAKKQRVAACTDAVLPLECMATWRRRTVSASQGTGWKRESETTSRLTWAITAIDTHLEELRQIWGARCRNPADISSPPLCANIDLDQRRADRIVQNLK